MIAPPSSAVAPPINNTLAASAALSACSVKATPRKLVQLGPPSLQNSLASFPDGSNCVNFTAATQRSRPRDRKMRS
jgi:hypothetical protein